MKTVSICDKKIVLTSNLYVVVLLAIFVLTTFNGFYNSLNVEYERKKTTFLADPLDRHGDLIKAALAFPPFVPNHIAGLDHYSLRFYNADFYHGLEGIDHREVTGLHVPPFMLTVLLLAKRGVLLFGPVPVIYFFYAIAYLALTLVLAKFKMNLGEACLGFIVLGLSYPFLMIMSRGNCGALITSLSLIMFFYELFIRRKMSVAALILALAFNCRPNVIVLFPLLLIFGGRGFIKSAVFFGVFASILLLTSYSLAVHFYPGYDSSVFWKALNIYYSFYVIGMGGDAFNNSAYGAFKPFIYMGHFPYDLLCQVLQGLLAVMTTSVAFLIPLFSLLYLRRQIDKYEFAFALSALSVLGTAVFATYHLFFFFAFVLIAAAPSFVIDRKRAHYLVLMACIFVLVPKNYIFVQGISLEVVLNPLVLAATLILIFRRRRPCPAKDNFWETLHWEMDAGPATGFDGQEQLEAECLPPCPVQT